MPEGGISDEELLKRLSAIYSEAFVAVVGKELLNARKAGMKSGSGKSTPVSLTGCTI